MLGISLDKQLASSELAKTVKTKKDADRVRLMMSASSRPSSSKDSESEAFEIAKQQFIARYNASEILYSNRRAERKSPTTQWRQNCSNHRISPDQAHKFRELQYSVGMLHRESPLDQHIVNDSSNATTSDNVQLSTVDSERKPHVIHQSAVPRHETGEFVEATSDASPKRKSIQSDFSDYSFCSETTLYDVPSDAEILRKYKENKEYADESTWRTASVIMRAYAKNMPIPSRKEDWAILPGARRPKGGALRRSSAQRIPNVMRRNSMKRQLSSHANN